MKTIFHFVSTNVLSGLENVVINICTLVKGYNFVYVSPSGPINYYLHKYHIKHICLNRVTPLNVRNVINKYNPDIVQGHDVKASLSLALNYFLCHKKHIKVLSELHNDDPRMWHYSLRSVLYALSTPFYDNIIVISKAVINHYIFRKFINHKTIVISNIVNKNRILLKKSNVKKWDCIFLGRLVNQKDPLKFVKIIKHLRQYKKNVKAIMLGEGPLKESVQLYINKYNLKNNIKMVGFKSNPFVYLSESKVLLMPSKYEGFGLVALESLLVGTPVICSHTGGLVNIINISCGKFANSVKEYVNDVIELLTDERIYKLKSKSSIRRGNKINNITQFIFKYKTIYSK